MIMANSRSRRAGMTHNVGTVGHLDQRPENVSISRAAAARGSVKEIILISPSKLHIAIRVAHNMRPHPYLQLVL